MLLKMYLLNRISDMNVSSAVVVLSDVEGDENNEALRWLEAGAVDFIKIPSSFQEMKRIRHCAA